MLLSELLAAGGCEPLTLRGEAEIAHVTDDSRRVARLAADGRGVCFVAMRGPVSDGHAWIDRAVADGCAAVLCENPAAVPSDMPCAVLADTRACLGPLAQALLGWPSRRLKLIGVTGTKGKTTVATICQTILAAAGLPCGLIGTIACDTLARRIDSSNTTPGAVDLAALMAEMLDAGARAAVMEVSSHALDQQRTAGLDFAAAVFTNLHGEHLDYHGTMDNYLAAKARLFADLAPSAAAVLNADDARSAELAALTPARVRTYGIEAEADVRAAECVCGSSAATWRLDAPAEGFSQAVRSRLIGRHNVYNSLAAAAACRAVGVEWPAIAETLAGELAVPGRLQRVPGAEPYGFDVYVDYAHTDESLRNVLAALRPLCERRLIVLFGCGGDRDRTKRPRMARAAAEGADCVVLTSDNPRSEDPQAIIDEVLTGFGPESRRGENLHVEPDRAAAIAVALALAEPGDIVLLAGKGHETYQIIGERVRHFDDAEVAAECLAARG